MRKVIFLTTPELWQRGHGPDHPLRPMRLKRTVELLEEFEEKGGLNFEGRVRSTLRGLGFGEEDFSLPLRAISGGQKKLLELGRTMMVDAKVVLLDEVGAGVNRTLLAEIGDAIIRLNKERGYTFCMIEHDMDFIGRMCDPVIVMAEGSVLATGSAEEVRNNEDVIEAYL